MSTVALQHDDYKFIDSTRIVGNHARTVHIDNSVYIQIEHLLDRFLSNRHGMDVMRDFTAALVLPHNRELIVKIDTMYVYWRKCSAEDGEWLEVKEISPMWWESHLYDEEGEQLPHDFDLNVVLQRLTFH